MIACDRMCLAMCDCKLMFFGGCVHDYVYICYQCLCEKREGVTRRCLGVNVSGENECMGAGLCASVLAVNVIVF